MTTRHTLTTVAVAGALVMAVLAARLGVGLRINLTSSYPIGLGSFLLIVPSPTAIGSSSGRRIPMCSSKPSSAGISAEGFVPDGSVR
jgi:hypothetical protein